MHSIHAARTITGELHSRRIRRCGIHSLWATHLALELISKHQSHLPRSPGSLPMKHLCWIGHSTSRQLADSMQVWEAIWASNIMENLLGKVGLWQGRVFESWGPSSQGRFTEHPLVQYSGLALLHITSSAGLESHQLRPVTHNVC